MFREFRVFDAHFHIIDSRFPLVPNNGFLPEVFTCTAYLDRMREYNLCGGAVISGSFQALDRSWLVSALQALGPGFTGVAQLPVTVTDTELLEFDTLGIRALRFNLKRGGSESLTHLDSMARRVYEVAGWHVELYVDSSGLIDLFDTLSTLPAVSIDHLGLTVAGFGTLLKLVERGVHVKASGFGRLDFDVRTALRQLYAANPDALMFGTDLPSTRAAKSYTDDDCNLVIEALGEEEGARVLYTNAVRFYRPRKSN